MIQELAERACLLQELPVAMQPPMWMHQNMSAPEIGGGQGIHRGMMGRRHKDGYDADLTPEQRTQRRQYQHITGHCLRMQEPMLNQMFEHHDRARPGQQGPGR